jgi:hypothetical protein
MFSVRQHAFADKVKVIQSDHYEIIMGLTGGFVVRQGDMER